MGPCAGANAHPNCVNAPTAEPHPPHHAEKCVCAPGTHSQGGQGAEWSRAGTSAAQLASVEDGWGHPRGGGQAGQRGLSAGSRGGSAGSRTEPRLHPALPADGCPWPCPLLAPRRIPAGAGRCGRQRSRGAGGLRVLGPGSRGGCSVLTRRACPGRCAQNGAQVPGPARWRCARAGGCEAEEGLATRARKMAPVGGCCVPHQSPSPAQPGRCPEPAPGPGPCPSAAGCRSSSSVPAPGTSAQGVPRTSPASSLAISPYFHVGSPAPARAASAPSVYSLPVPSRILPLPPRAPSPCTLHPPLLSWQSVPPARAQSTSWGLGRCLEKEELFPPDIKVLALIRPSWRPVTSWGHSLCCEGALV